ncbi:hypothetical protein HJFPF1_04051 [Paramyrothecium foliicola]|nr:hypothetical protein HJFPF1_04051 [Paramyrothecium foliicola]
MARFTWPTVAGALALALCANKGLAQSDAQQPLASHNDIGPEDASKPGKIVIYNEDEKVNDRRYYQGRRLESRIEVPPNVCVSGNFTLDYNVLLSKSATCPDERYSYVAIYLSGDCTGQHAHPTWHDGGAGGFMPGHTLGPAVWGRDSNVTFLDNQWSMAFQCGYKPSGRRPQPVENFVPADTMKVSIPQPEPKPEPKPKPRAHTASVSDSACFIDELGTAGFPRFIFQKPSADVCVNVAAKHKLTIYRNALCENGTEALFAQFNDRGCRGDPIVLQDVSKDMLGANSDNKCIEMGGEKVSSYVFLCTGELRTEKVVNDLFSEDGGTRLHYSNAPIELNRDQSIASTNRVFGDLGMLLSVVGLIAGYLTLS